jgi:hypothetical protein
MTGPTLTNAVLRCTRDDDDAAGLFALARPDLGLWVLDLDWPPNVPLAEQLAGIHRQLQAHLVRLEKLREGSVDYTLHLTFDLPEHEPIVLPPSLISLASRCGFNLELYVSRKEDLIKSSEQ